MSLGLAHEILPFESRCWPDMQPRQACTQGPSQCKQGFKAHTASKPADTRIHSSGRFDRCRACPQALLQCETLQAACHVACNVRPRLSGSQRSLPFRSPD